MYMTLSRNGFCGAALDAAHVVTKSQITVGMWKSGSEQDNSRSLQ